MDVHEKVIDLIRKKPVLFIGAGISFNSGIPTVYPLKKAILKGFNLLDDKEIDEIASLEIPFESFISSLQSDCRSIKTLYGIYNLGKPNLNHYLIAHLSLLGHVKVIITTNFDTLIEQAFEKIGNTKFKVYITQKQIKNIDLGYNGTIIIKIHGCVSSIQTIATTLKRVSGVNSYDYRKKVVQNIFCGIDQNRILSMGYSFSDAFDITPAIEGCPNKETQVYILDHKPELNIVQNISVLKDTHPIKKFKNSKKFDTNFDSLIIEIWRKFVDQNPATINQTLDANYKENINNRVSKIVKNWVIEVEREFSISAFHSMIAGIYIKVSNYPKAKYHYKKAISIAKEDYLFENVLHFTTGLVMVLDNEGKYDEVIELTQEMSILIKKISEDDEFIFYEMVFLEYQGKSLQSNLKFEEAQNSLLKAFEFSKTLKDKNHEVFCMTLLATNMYNLNRYSEALSWYKKAEIKYLKVGDITGLSFNHSELAKLYEEKGEYPHALKCLNKSLAISKKINNKSNIAIDLADMGRVKMLDKKLDEAEIDYNNALKIFSKIEDGLGEAICINNYAFLKKEKGLINEALAFHKQAIKIFIRFKYYPSLRIAYESLGEIYLNMNDVKKSHYYYNRARKV
jgi:tetratricopeptide (TPR) repeat protein